MKVILSISVLLLVGFSYIRAQDTLKVKPPKVLSAQSILMVKTENTKADTTQYKMPKYKQGFFCNFEDQLNRKKVPVDFNLGNSKY